ncbi:MAG: cytochrome c-type biogenesis protein CcmH [Chloroflexi bacterium]|nr:cytochrome c-type biogenesis protein CcmH [Chloroflexota bacterium]
MKLRAISVFAALFMALVLWGMAQAQSIDEKVRDVAQALECPVCENLSVADSPSDLAQEMKALIREKLEQGQSKEEILQYFVSRYGEEILRDPPKTGFGLVVWWGPVAGLAIGAGVIYLFFRELSRKRGAQVQLPEPSEEDVRKYGKRLEEELGKQGGKPI